MRNGEISSRLYRQCTVNKNPHRYLCSEGVSCLSATETPVVIVQNLTSVRDDCSENECCQQIQQLLRKRLHTSDFVEWPVLIKLQRREGGWRVLNPASSCSSKFMALTPFSHCGKQTLLLVWLCSVPLKEQHIMLLSVVAVHCGVFISPIIMFPYIFIAAFYAGLSLDTFWTPEAHVKL